MDTRAQGHGIGRALLRHVFGLAIDQRDALGCVGVVTDAKPDAVEFYRRLGFLPLGDAVEGTLLGAPLPMFLAIDVIGAT